jgi:hypothetical protein
MKNEIKASRAIYIKLGVGGEWDDYCLKEFQALRIGYREIDHEACLSGKKWDATVLDQCREIVKGRNLIAAKNHRNQLRSFYEAPARDTIWITFSGDCLWWCVASNEIKPLEENDKIRRLSRNWSNSDVNGKRLTYGTLNGRLLATKGYRQTICDVKETKYLIDKLNGRVSRDVLDAQRSLTDLAAKLEPLIRKLNEDDFEVLIDLIFRQGGFYRTGKLGGTQKDIDLDLINPVSGEKVAIQVKSSASKRVFDDYLTRFGNMAGGYSRFIFATHSPQGKWGDTAKCAESNTELWLADKIAEQAARLGLAGWLIDKAI